MEEPENNINYDDSKNYLMDYVIILAKYSRMIIFTSAAVTVLAYLILFILPNKYKATARLLPPQQNLTLSAQLLDSLGGRVSPGAGVAGAGGAMGGMAASLLGLKSAGEIYVAMMTSEPVLDQIIARFNLMKFYKTRYLEDARKALSKNTKITAGKQDGIIVIEVTCTIPKLGAEMANAFIEELDRLLQGFALQEAKGRMAFLEKERLQASQNLSKAEVAVRQFSEQNGVLQIETQTRGTLEYVARLRAEIDAKEVQIQVLRYQATPRNSEMIRMETETKGLKERLHNAESQLENCVSDVCLPTSKAPGLGLEYLRLFREAKFQEKLYQLYSKLVEVARLDMARDIAVLQVLAPALPPEKRSNRRGLPSIVAGILTLVIMSFVAFMREHIQDMKTREDDAQRLSMLEDYLQPWTDMLVRIKNIILFKRKF